MRHGWMAALFVLLMNGCQPQQPNEIPRSRPALASDNTPSRADPPQAKDSGADAVNPQLDTRGGAVPPGDAPGASPPSSGTPTAEQIDHALAACGRLPASQQEPCRSRIGQASAEPVKDR